MFTYASDECEAKGFVCQRNQRVVCVFAVRSGKTFDFDLEISNPLAAGGKYEKRQYDELCSPTYLMRAFQAIIQCNWCVYYVPSGITDVCMYVCIRMCIRRAGEARETQPSRPGPR